MDVELKTKWVEALRSGKYPQTDGALRKGEGFCCLGVLCDVMGATWRHADARIDGELQISFLSDGALHRAGLKHAEQQKLYRMNDGGSVFPEIADFIEREL